MESVDPKFVFPCLTHESYLHEGKDGIVTMPLGHGLVTMLWLDQGSVLKNVSTADFQKLGLDEDGAWNLAFENLNRALNDGQFHFEVVGFTDGEKILVARGHWLTATLMLHGGLYTFVSEQLRTDEICAAAPHREMLIFFGRNCSVHIRTAVGGIFKDAQAESRKPFQFGIFKFSEQATEPL